ncbi:MAG: DNA-3-methyladenine glycosylase [Microgenomates group bacterium Gr01-1014_16]|nr:MAG: DNA-3-methyladenine glycosylase [Microgenomates group bacterium Gr01-1014_16]
MKNLRKGLVHLRRDPILAVQIAKFGVINYQQPKDRFENLVSTIIGQQLSNKAADTIYERVLSLFPNRKIDPDWILNLESSKFRAAGTSWAKIRSLKDLSQKILDKSVLLDQLDLMTDDQVISHLTQVKGIGPWTAQMKLMFTLHRPDVMPVDDRGIQNAMIKLYGLKDGKKLTTNMLKTSNSWRPYRTLACWYLWKSLDNK